MSVKREFYRFPINDYDGIPRAAMMARFAAFERVYDLCQVISSYSGEGDEAEEDAAMKAIESLPAALKELRKPLLPSTARRKAAATKPKLRVRRVAG